MDAVVLKVASFNLTATGTVATPHSPVTPSEVYIKTLSNLAGESMHPLPNRQMIMAYAFVKAPGCDGEIRAITADLKREQVRGDAGPEDSFRRRGCGYRVGMLFPFAVAGFPKRATTGGHKF